jgi:hypothetical protein
LRHDEIVEGIVCEGDLMDVSVLIGKGSRAKEREKTAAQYELDGRFRSLRQRAS